MLEERSGGSSGQLTCDRDKTWLGGEGETCTCVEGIDSVEGLGVAMGLRGFAPGLVQG